jgi:hypothetical protein
MHRIILRGGTNPQGLKINNISKKQKNDLGTPFQINTDKYFNLKIKGTEKKQDFDLFCKYIL